MSTKTAPDGGAVADFWDAVGDALGLADGGEVFPDLPERVVHGATALVLLLQEDEEWPLEQGLSDEEYLGALIGEASQRAGFEPVGMAPGSQFYYGPAGHGKSAS